MLSHFTLAIMGQAPPNGNLKMVSNRSEIREPDEPGGFSPQVVVNMRQARVYPRSSAIEGRPSVPG
jgi:hypothetical protein